MQEIEQLMVDLGVQRYDSAVTKAKERGALSTVPHGHALLRHVTTKMEEGLRAWMKMARHRPGPNHLAVKFLLL